MKLTKVEVAYCGVDGESYFAGGGTAYSKWTHSATGIGDTPRDAMKDALEGLTQQVGDFPDTLINDGELACDPDYGDARVPSDLEAAHLAAGDNGECELHCYAVAYAR